MSESTKETGNTDADMQFNADVARLLDIVANALYSNRDVFLRELISNAADACDKLRYEAISNPDLLKDDPDLRLEVSKDAASRRLHIVDNGIGMNRDDLVDQLGTIAKSGTHALMDQINTADKKEDRLNLIGQFGVGFYATFMVADRVEVISRKAGEQTVWHWESDGRSGFSVREASEREAKDLISERGTAIIAHIKPDGSDFLLDEKIRQVITTYSDHISFPIYLSVKNEDGLEAKEQVNAASALWMRPKSDIGDEQYQEFYKHISHGMGFDAPLMTSHWRAEGKIEYTALLFTPSIRPWDLYDPSRRPTVRLYVRRVFITDNCEGLVYPWLRFLRGVIDSEDLPLNISREMLQHNLIVQKIRSGVARRILSDLNKLSGNDPDAFANFWQQYGAVVKEGLYDAHDHREDIFKICRFQSTHDQTHPVSLEDYVSRMKDGQKHIYYISGENLETLRHSPQLEGFKSRGLEVLFMTDTIDDFWLQAVESYKEYDFISVTRGDIDLGAFEKETADTQEPHEDRDEKDGKPDTESLDTLRRYLKTTLGEEVGDVRLSSRLTESPVCLIAGENEVDMHMERVLKIHQNYEPQSKRVLEINGDHKLIRDLAKIAESEKKEGTELDDAAWLLLDQARIIQGEPVPDPARFARRMSQFLSKGIGG